jgi:hypothetical protein
MEKIIDILIKLAARGLKGLLAKSASRSKRVTKLVEVMSDEDVLELMKEGSKYLAAKSTNSIDDKLVAELSKQTTLKSSAQRRTVKRPITKRGK